MAASRLSKEAETKIMNALSEAAELVNSGSTPNEAIAKSASASNIPVGQVELMVRAFNVGRSEAQRNSGAETHEKLAEFELADSKSVMEIMFPSNVKSASAYIKDSSISDIYSKGPAIAAKVLPELPPLMPLIKQASINTPAKDTLGETRQLGSYIEKIGSAASKLNVDSAMTRDKVTAGINKLANYFRSFGNKPFMVVKDNSEKLFGKKATALLDIILTANRQLKKQAGTVADSMAPVNLDEEPYKSIKGCIDLASIHLNKQASAAFLNKLAKQVLTSGFSSSIPSEKSGSVLEGLDKSAAFSDWPMSLRGTTRGILGDAYKLHENPDPSLKMENLKDEVLGTELERERFKTDQLLQSNQIKNIRASSTLADLMSNDEIISSHHPDDVIFHFNEISKVMPESAINTAIMRPLLRKRLEGGTAAIDPFDVAQMVEMESYRRERETPTYNTRKLLQYPRVGKKKPPEKKPPEEKSPGEKSPKKKPEPKPEPPKPEPPKPKPIIHPL